MEPFCREEIEAAPYKAYIWRDGCRFVVMAHARSVAHARALFESEGHQGDESTPIRQMMTTKVRETMPEIFRGDVAEAVITDSAELEESDLYRETQRKQILDLQAERDRLAAEVARLEGEVGEAREVITGFRLTPRRNHGYCETAVKYPDWETPQDDRCSICERADTFLQRTKPEAKP